MKLHAYDIIITLRDPDDHETFFSLTLDRVERDKILNVKFPLACSLLAFEDAVDD